MKKLLLLTSSVLMLGAITLNNVSAQDVSKISEVSVSFEPDLTPLEITQADVFKFSADHSILESNVPASENVTVSVMDNSVLGHVGWTLKAEITDFKQGENVSLKGAEITLPIADSSSSLEQTNFESPTPRSITLNNESQTVVDASRSKNPQVGFGPWTFSWTGTEINMNIPEGASTPGDHTATVTWSMIVAPS